MEEIMSASIIGFTNITGSRIAIPVCRITGFVEAADSSYGKTFIATGADNADGEENGWYVAESYNEVYVMLEAVLDK
jgi:hypothetical protein